MDELAELAALGTKLAYQKGEIIIRPTDNANDIFMLTNGIVSAYTITATGEKNMQLLYNVDEMFPVASIVQKRLPNVYYEALADCEVVRMPTAGLIEYLEEHEGASFDMLNRVIKQMILYKARVDVLEYRFARERVAYQLLTLGKRYGTISGNKLVMPYFPQDTLAESCNVSRESVNRELKRFERLGYLRREGSKLHVTNFSELRKQIAPLDTPLFIDDL